MSDRDYEEANRDVWRITTPEGEVIGTLTCPKGALEPEQVAQDFADREPSSHVFQVSVDEEAEYVSQKKAKPEEPYVDTKFVEGRRYVHAKAERGEVYGARVVTTELEMVKPIIVFEKAGAGRRGGNKE